VCCEVSGGVAYPWSGDLIRLATQGGASLFCEKGFNARRRIGREAKAAERETPAIEDDGPLWLPVAPRRKEEEAKSKVDRRPGKMPLPPDEPEQKEGDQQQAVSHFAPSRADHDASAMVSALAHVISSSSSVLDTRGGESAPTQQGIKLEAAGPGDTEATQVSEEQGMP
ncbi:hypothetical protein BHE74_00041170, partial [Ensete ventricosum]